MCEYTHTESPSSVIKTNTIKRLRLTMDSETKMLSLENEAHFKMIFFFWYTSKTTAFLIQI